ncbi:SUMF1/EgtB/PvdO family nonheme iron enzyme [Fulvivirgaceae bacterium BMA10]|uniref:SUMF1/EgtB/PvdO family nonheme iron enzyme n=1 Tax=Splendidivirga corallicola TaxID=3051826 RepID=A0ABT8KST1_9BACT|nr:SUMF1/EgtB/PvdO family nonheme iron enzyme [Fulvivirgaceae bacterium BMA10]
MKLRRQFLLLTYPLILFFVTFLFSHKSWAQDEDPDSHSSKTKVTQRYEELRKLAGSTKMIYIEGGVYEGKKVEAFHMDETMVTVEQYMACVEAGVCPHPPDNGLWSATFKKSNSKLPINEISFHNAQTFAQWIGKRLPTEHEWEWVASGRGEGRIYPWGNSAPTRESACWQRWDAETDSGGGPCEVGKLAFSKDGVKDMAGNLWEWTSTSYNDEGTLIILKGGAWYNDDPSKLKVKARGVASPYHRGNGSDGFRCVSSIKKE